MEEDKDFEPERRRNAIGRGEHWSIALIAAIVTAVGVAAPIAFETLSWSRGVDAAEAVTNQQVAVQAANYSGLDKRVSTLEAFEATVSTQLSTVSNQIAALSQKLDDQAGKRR